MTQFEPITPSQAANLLASSIKSSGQYYLATSDGGQPGQTIQVNGIVAICQQSIPPGPIILVNQGQQWYAYAPRINQESSTRVVQNSRRRRKSAKNRYKITIFYLTQDNSVFCREDDESPIKLVDKLPKRIDLNVGASASAPGMFSGGYGRLGLNSFGWALQSSISLDDYRPLTQFQVSGPYEDQTPNYYFYYGTYFEDASFDGIRYESNTTADIQGSVTPIIAPGYNSNMASVYIALFDIFYMCALSSINPDGVKNYSGTNRWPTQITWSNDNVGFTYGGDRTNYFGYLDNPSGESFGFDYVEASQGSGSASISTISNAWGFAARCLPDKTVFAVTDGVAINNNVRAYRNRITTGTIDEFDTYQLPVVPQLDDDLFFPISLGEGGNFQKFRNMYQIPSFSQRYPYEIIPIIDWQNYSYDTIRKPGPILLSNPYNDDFFTFCAYGQGSQEDLEEQLKGVGSFELQVYDSQLHDIVFELDENETTPIKHRSEWRQNIRTAGDFETVTISGLPSDTKRVLGILAVPVNE